MNKAKSPLTNCLRPTAKFHILLEKKLFTSKPMDFSLTSNPRYCKALVALSTTVTDEEQNRGFYLDNRV